MIQELRQEHNLAILLVIAQLPKATYYYHRKKEKATDKYAHAKAEIQAIFHDNKGRYGYRRITDELRNRGFSLNHKTVQRLMKELLDLYTALHEHDPLPPDRECVSSAAKQRNRNPTPPAPQKGTPLRTDNTSGHVGVTRHRDRWVAKITYQKKTYSLGSFVDKEQAILARKNAEALLAQSPDIFLSTYINAVPKD